MNVTIDGKSSSIIPFWCYLSAIDQSLQRQWKGNEPFLTQTDIKEKCALFRLAAYCKPTHSYFDNRGKGKNFFPLTKSVHTFFKISDSNRRDGELRFFQRPISHSVYNGFTITWHNQDTVVRGETVINREVFSGYA